MGVAQTQEMIEEEWSLHKIVEWIAERISENAVYASDVILGYSILLRREKENQYKIVIAEENAKYTSSYSWHLSVGEAEAKISNYTIYLFVSHARVKTPASKLKEILLELLHEILLDRDYDKIIIDLTIT